MITYLNEKLFVDGVEVKGLADKYRTPLFIYSKRQIASSYRQFNSSFRKVKHLVCYALKANSNIDVLKTLAKSGAGVDVTSGGELYRALRAGFKPKKCVYAGIGKTPEEIEYALKNDILMFNVESIDELYTINSISGRLGKKAPIAFRINPHVDAHTHKYITTGKSGSKFGIPYPESVKAYKTAHSLSNINIVGIHCHIGSQITEVKPFNLAAKRIYGIYNELISLGIGLKYIDLGGGLGIKYNNEKPALPKDLYKAVIPVFKGFKGAFVFEPGRFIVGNAGVLIAKVIYRKKADGKNFMIVDAGMNDLIRPTLYEAYHDIVPVLKSDIKPVKVDIVGPICETGDFLGKMRMLPMLKQGDYIAVKSAGAYSMAMASQYNSRLRAPEVIVDGNKAYLSRERETYKDLIVKEKKGG